MDAKFHPAIAAMKSGDVDAFRALLEADPTLATSRSSTSHPTLLQCLVLDHKDAPWQLEAARILLAGGAEVNGPFVACASIDNAAAAVLLLEHGAVLDGTDRWSPLEEALYWNSRHVLDLLLERGARIQNLRSAAGLGRVHLMETFFARDGSLRSEAGRINWPWGDLDVIERSCRSQDSKEMLAAKFRSFGTDRQSIINNALVYACMHGHIDAARFLLERGAEVNAIAGGFDFSGTALHYAALNGHREMVEYLLAHGADVNIRDTKVDQTPAGWAKFAGYPELVALLQSP